MNRWMAALLTTALFCGTAFSTELFKADFSGSANTPVTSIPAGDPQLSTDGSVSNKAFGILGGTVNTTNWQYNAAGDALLNQDLYTAPNWGAPTRFDLGLQLAAAGKTYTITNVEVVVSAANAVDVNIDLWAARDAASTFRVNTSPVLIPAGATGTFSIDTSLMGLIATDHGATWNQAGNGDLRLGVYSTNGVNADTIEISEIRVNGIVDDFAVQTDTLWEFDGLGDTEGWSQDLNEHIVGLTASNGVLTADSIAANDPQVVQWGAFAPALGYWDSMTIRVRQLNSLGNPLPWDASGCAVVLGDEIISSTLGGTGWEVTPGAGGWIVASRDISSLGTNQLDYLRFDPVGQLSGTNKTFEVDYVELTSRATPAAPTPPENSYWEFNMDGDPEGWSAFGNGHIDALTVGNGVLASDGISGGDPQLIGPAVVVGSYYWTTAEIRVRQLESDGTPTNWLSTGCAFLINNVTVSQEIGDAGWDVIEEAGEWITASISIADFGSSDISSIRVDPVGSPSAVSKNFEIDYIRLHNQPTPLPPETNWEFNTDGNLEGWTGSADIDTLFVSNGVLSAVDITGNDPQLNKAGILGSEGFYWTTVEMRVRHLDVVGTPIAFSASGLTAVIDGTIIQGSNWGFTPDSGEWVIATIALTQFGSDDLNGIRIDPVGNSADKNFEVDYIRFNTSLAPLVPNLEHSWEFDTLGDTEGLTGNAAISGLTVADAVSGSERVLTAADLTGNDSQILLPSPAGIDAGGNSWGTLEIRARQLDGNPPGGSPQAWDDVGTIIIVNGSNLGLIPGANTTTNNGSDGWVTATVDISSLGAAAINNFRLDVVGGSGSLDKNFEIDYIRAYSKIPPVGYDAWSFAYGLSGGAGAPGADPDEDTFDNFYEYAFGGNPVDPTNIGLLSEASVVNVGSNVLELISYERKAVNSGVDYSLEAKENLLSGGWDGLTETVDYTVTGTASFNTEMNAVTNHISTDLDTMFIRARATEQ